MEKRFPENMAARVSCLPALRALLLQGNKPARAIELLEVAVPYELGAVRNNLHGSHGALYPAYVRGRALLAAHQGT
jgi:hypothetical protein